MEEYSVYNETDDMFEGEDISTEEFPDFVQQFAEKQASAVAAAKRGIVDDIIVPYATRKMLIAAFELLYTKCEDKPAKKHGSK